MAATRSVASALSRPPRVPAAAIWPYLFLAVCGSNRSLAISQKPDARIGPAAEIWRYTATAVASGACDLTAHSIRNNTPLATNVTGTHVPGPARRAALALATTSSIVGSAAMSWEVRKSASRTALPLTNWAVTAAAPSIAATTDRDLALTTSMISAPPSYASLTRHSVQNPAECG